MDIAYLLLLQNFRESTGNALSVFFSKVTLMGEETLPYLMLFGLYWCIDKRRGVRAIASIGLARILNTILKLSFCVYRPWIRSDAIQPYGDSKVTASGYSFPSGHTTNATVGLGSFGWHYRREKLLSFTCYLTIGLVMLSRNYLGVHTPQDVIVGLLATIAMMVLADFLMNWCEKGKNRDLLFTVLMVALAFAVLFWLTHKSYPLAYGADGKLIVDPKAMMPDGFGDAGMLIGCVLGLQLEKRFANFNTDCSANTKMTRFAVGALLYAFCKHGGGGIFPLLLGGKMWGSFAAKMTMMLFASGIYPILFTRWEKKHH